MAISEPTAVFSIRDDKDQEITTYKNARSLIRRIDRDDLLQALVRDYVRNG